jgi:hypothetical protein
MIPTAIDPGMALGKGSNLLLALSHFIFHHFYTHFDFSAILYPGFHTFDDTVDRTVLLQIKYLSDFFQTITTQSS